MYCAEIEMILVDSNNFLAENIRNIVIWNLVILILYALGGKMKKIISKIIEGEDCGCRLAASCTHFHKGRNWEAAVGYFQLDFMYTFSIGLHVHISNENLFPSFFNWTEHIYICIYICNAKACNPLSTHSHRLAATKFLGYSAKSP